MTNEMRERIKNLMEKRPLRKDLMSFPLKKYIEDMGAVSWEIKGRSLCYKKKDHCIETISFGKDVPKNVTLDGLCKEDGNEGDLVYYVYKDGYNGYDWIYPLKIGPVLRSLPQDDFKI